ncbi:hypothetical protein GC176_05165 [bacterium]|nr:hypothetical protein [bacterium]
MTPFEAIQQSRNRESSTAWDLYEPHRRRVTSLILDALPSVSNDSAPQPRVCLLGAGNSNDIDLSELATRCEEVLLVDLDAAALQQGVARQQLTEHPAIRLRAEMDITGIFDRLNPDNATSRLNHSAEIVELAEIADSFSGSGLPDGFDVVASMCLLSQLIDAVTHCFPDPHTALPLLQAMRRRHLRLLLEQCRPGGRAILFSEIVSSDTCPELAATPDARLPDLLARLLAEQNFFTGLHPGIIVQDLRSESRLLPLVANVRPIAPWKWPFLSRTYAVTAFVIERAAVAG